MAEFNKVDRCYHCGVVLQTENKDEPGYITKEIKDKYPQGLLLCDECFKNERFNIVPKANDTIDSEYQMILDEIKRKNALVVYVVDVFSFEGSFISKLNKDLEDIDCLAIANKADLLPENTDYDYVLEYVTHQLRMAKLNVLTTVLASSNNGFNIDLMYENIIKYSKNRDVYFIGASESGKSALIQEFLKRFKNNTNKLITTYTFKNTQLRGFKIPFNKDNYIYETPGFNPINSMRFKVDKQSLNAIIPTKSIKPKLIKMCNNNFLFLGGLAVVQLIKGYKENINVFVSDKVMVDKTHFNDFKSAQNKIKKKKLYPLSSTLKSLSDFDAFDIEIKESGYRDLGILGLGWISFKGNNQIFRVYIPKGVYIYTTREKIKYVNK